MAIRRCVQIEADLCKAGIRTILPLPGFCSYMKIRFGAISALVLTKAPKPASAATRSNPQPMSRPTPPRPPTHLAEIYLLSPLCLFPSLRTYAFVHKLWSFAFYAHSAGKNLKRTTMRQVSRLIARTAEGNFWSPQVILKRKLPRRRQSPDPIPNPSANPSPQVPMRMANTPAPSAGCALAPATSCTLLSMTRFAAIRSSVKTHNSGFWQPDSTTPGRPLTP